jgi:hypothetical protein
LLKIANRQSLACNISLLARQADDVAARSRQTRDEAGTNRIGRQREDNRDDRFRPFFRDDRFGRIRYNNIDPQLDELGCDLSVALPAALSPANLNRDVVTPNPPEFAQPLHKSGDPLARG